MLICFHDVSLACVQLVVVSFSVGLMLKLISTSPTHCTRRLLYDPRVGPEAIVQVRSFQNCSLLPRG